MSEASTKAVAGFAVWAATYDQTIADEVQRYMGMPYAQVLRRVWEGLEVAPDACVLDVGTGTGALALAVAQQLTEGRVVAIDPTLEMLRRGQEHARCVGLADRLEFHCVPAERMPFPDASFDAVVSSIALHHSHVRDSLCEIARVLKPGGYLSIADPARNIRWDTPLALLMKPLLGLFYLVKKRSLTIMRAELDSMKQLFVKDEWEAMLREVGLEPLEVVEVPHPTSDWYSSMLFIRATKPVRTSTAWCEPECAGR